jgi:hypothetical protein
MSTTITLHFPSATKSHLNTFEPPFTHQIFPEETPATSDAKIILAPGSLDGYVTAQNKEEEEKWKQVMGKQTLMNQKQLEEDYQSWKPIGQKIHEYTMKEKGENVTYQIYKVLALLRSLMIIRGRLTLSQITSQKYPFIT